MFHFGTRKRLHCACMYACLYVCAFMCISIYIVCIYLFNMPRPLPLLRACTPIVLGCWPGRKHTYIYICMYGHIDPCSDHGLGQIPRWIQPVVLPFILCVFNIVCGEASWKQHAEKLDTHNLNWAPDPSLVHFVGRGSWGEAGLAAPANATNLIIIS